MKAHPTENLPMEPSYGTHSSPPRVGTALNGALFSALRDDPRVILLGEDIVDPYGGAFKITRGLSTAFPDRVRATPVSEAAIAGISAGLALMGYRPIAEIMFGDFVSLAFDQIVNHIAKYEAMYDGQATCPVIIRFPSGGHRGYGPTHSQSLEKHLLGVPYLRVTALSAFVSPSQVLSHLLNSDAPTILVEHKLLYAEKLQKVIDHRVGDLEARLEGSPGRLPTVGLSPVPAAECHITLVAYGYLASLAARVIEELAIEEEFFVDLLVPADLSWLDLDPIVRSVTTTGYLMTAEEGTEGFSWGSEVATRITKACFHDLKGPVEVLTSAPAIIPSARQREREVLMGRTQLLEALRRYVEKGDL